METSRSFFDPIGKSLLDGIVISAVDEFPDGHAHIKWYERDASGSYEPRTAHVRPGEPHFVLDAFREWMEVTGNRPSPQRFTLIDVHAVHRAMQEARVKASEKPAGSSSRQAIEGHAAQLKDLLDKLLDGFPEDVKARYGRR